MEDNDKTKEQLIDELQALRQEMALMKKYRSISDNELDRSIVPDANSASFLYDANGEQLKIPEILHDSSERKQSEKELIENQKIFRVLNDLMSDYIFKLTVQDDGSFQMSVIAGNYTAATGRLVGSIKSPADWYKTIHPEDLNKLYEKLNQVMKQKTPVGVECRSFAEDGNLRWLEVTASPETDTMTNQVTSIYGSVRNITAKKLAEQNLLKSEERYRFIAERSNDLIFVYRLKPQLGFDYVSPSAEKITGYTPEDHYNDPMLGMKLVHPDDRHLLQNLQDGIVKMDSYTIRWVKKDGQVIWTESQNIPVYDEKGELVAIQGRATDVTERIRSEQILKARLHLIEFAQFHSRTEIQQKVLDELEMLTNSQVGFFHSVNTDQVSLTLQSWSTNTMQNMCKAEGQGQHYDIGKAGVWTDCVRQRKAVIHNDYNSLSHRKGMPEGHAPIIRELVVPVFRNEKIVAIVGVGNKPTDYNENDIEIVSLLADMAWDITEQKGSEESMKKLSQIVEQSPISILITNLDGTIEYANPKACETTGYLLNELVGTNPRVLKSGETSDCDYNDLWQSITTGKQWNGIFHNRKKNGEFYWESATISPIVDRNGKITHYLSIKEDITDKKIAEEKIKLQNERLHAIISAMPDLIFVIDKDGTYTEFYSADTESLVIPVNQIVGTNLRSVFDENSAKVHLENINKCIEERKLITYEYSIPKSESISYYEARLAPFGSDRVLTSVRDITIRKEAELEILDLNQNLELRIEKRTAQLAETNDNLQIEIDERIKASTALSEALDRLNKITDRIPGVVYQFRLRTDGTYCFPYVSEGIRNVIKVSPEAAIEDAAVIFNKIHPDDLAPLIDSIFASAKDLAFWQYEYRILVDDGTEHWLGGNSMPQPEEDGSVLWHGFISDITERKRIEEELKESQKRFSLFMDYLPAIVFMKDHEGRTMFVNKYMENAFGASAWVGKTMLEVFPNELGQKLLDDDISSMTLGYQKIEESLTQSDGKMHDFETQKFIIDRVGHEPWLGGIALDISDRKKAVAEIIEARNEAEKANQAKSEFLSRMSHELRTPMNSILGFAQLLQMGNLNPRQKAGVGHILTSGKHLLNLINEVLDIARIESGKVPIIREPIQVGELIVEMMDLVNPAIQKHQQTLKAIDSTVNQLFVISDRQRLRQVLLNLINNAIKYNCVKGTVTIKTEQGTISADGVPHIRISITDTGWGISPEDLPKLFKPFERIGAEKTDTEGTGLGLAVVLKLMEAMGGKVGVESNLGAGSTFWIELPQSTHANIDIDERETIQNETSRLTGSGGTVLYIEDNVSNLELVTQILSSERPEIRLITNKNGKMAVPLAIEYAPDLILLDLDLPDLHGAEVLGLLRNEKTTSQIPVIIISADALPKQLENLMHAGAENYLTKPLDIPHFLSVVDEWIGKGR